MSAEGLAVGLINQTLETFGSSNVERVDDFTIRNIETDSTFNISPDEENDNELHIFINDSHVDTLPIPSENEPKDDFLKSITQRAISFLNI